MDKVNDTKIDQRSRDIGYHSSANKAVEKLKAVKYVDKADYEIEYLYWIKFFYTEWVKWRNEADNRNELKKCPDCGSSLARKKGTSKKSGNDYDFISCSNWPKCKYTEDVKEDDLNKLPKSVQRSFVEDLQHQEAITERKINK